MYVKGIPSADDLPPAEILALACGGGEVEGLVLFKSLRLIKWLVFWPYNGLENGPRP